MSNPLTLDQWDFRNRRLEGTIGNNDFVTSESTLILASPKAEYSNETLANAKAIGLAQDIGFAQQRQVVQVFEVGSNAKYTLSSGRTNGNINLSRVLFDGRSLMKVLAPEDEGDTFDERDRPGYGDWMINLGSSLFSRPIGLMMVFRDLQNENVGGIFFQDAFLVSHNMQVSSNSPFIGEGVQLLYGSILPLNPAI